MIRAYMSPSKQQYESKIYKGLRRMLKIADCPFAAQIRSAMTAYLPMWDWRWGAAQLWQESSWIPTATNKGSGAKGLGQFLDGTWADVAEQLGFPADASPYDPAYAIPAYAFYMKQMRLEWSHVPRSEDERRKLTQASYNAGLGNILHAQRLVQQSGGNFNDAMTILAALPQVTGPANAQQTLDYVLNIAKWFGDLSTGPQP